MHLNPLSLGYESIAEIGIMTDLADKEKAALSTKQNTSPIKIDNLAPQHPIREIQYIWSVKSTEISLN